MHPILGTLEHHQNWHWWELWIAIQAPSTNSHYRFIAKHHSDPHFWVSRPGTGSTDLTIAKHKSRFAFGPFESLDLALTTLVLTLEDKP